MAVWEPKEILDSVGLGRFEQKRSTRVADVIRNEIASLLISKIRDPKLINASISRVELSDDLKYAKIYFTSLEREKGRYKVESGLQRAKGFIRSHLAKTLNLRYTPELQFYYDETVEKVEAMEKLFQEIAEERVVSPKDVNDNDS